MATWRLGVEEMNARAQGRQDAENGEHPGAPSLPEDILALFPDAFEESALGLIPQGWRVSTIGELAEISYGKNLPKSKLLPSGIPVYGAAGIIGYYSKAMFNMPVVLVTSRGSNSGTVHETFEPAFVTNNSFSIVPRSSTVSRHFIKYWLLHADIASRVTGSAQPQLTITNFSSLSVLQVPEPLSSTFDSLIESFWNKLSMNQEESRTLAGLRDTLLPRLISGELRVEDAARFLEEAGV